MLQWADLPVQQWQLVELFSGQGNVSAFFRQAGKTVASFDTVLGGKSMDVTQAAGFLFGVPAVENTYMSRCILTCDICANSTPNPM